MEPTTGQITRERLNRWSDKLALSDATPIVLLGVGHNRHSGQLVLCTLDEPEMDNQTIARFLRAALRALEK